MGVKEGPFCRVCVGPTVEHLLERDTCLSRPQAKRVGGAPAINMYIIFLRLWISLLIMLSLILSFMLSFM
jgi:hypothetical protein